MSPKRVAKPFSEVTGILRYGRLTITASIGLDDGGQLNTREVQAFAGAVRSYADARKIEYVRRGNSLEFTLDYTKVSKPPQDKGDIRIIIDTISRKAEATSGTSIVFETTDANVMI